MQPKAQAAEVAIISTTEPDAVCYFKDGCQSLVVSYPASLNASGHGLAYYLTNVYAHVHLGFLDWSNIFIMNTFKRSNSNHSSVHMCFTHIFF
mmetsp:Transcript_10449/g.18242  ORF Transcript_10449/g.18242 Transcript_10449/m.18242 type:complete len:93 (-) Transcript_10449:1680-1958(-)